MSPEIPDSPPETATILRGRARPLDPPDQLLELRDKAPLTRVTFPDGSEGWLVTRHPEVRRILTDNRFSSAKSRVLTAIRKLPEGAQESTPPGLFVGMDPPEHTRFRKVLTGYFTVRRMRLLEPRVEQIVQDRLDRLRTLPRPVDLVDEFAQPVVLLVICELLGVPEHMRADFVRRITTVGSPDADEAALIEARDGNRNAMLQLIGEKRERPDEGLISTIVNAHDEHGARTFTDAELTVMCLLLLVAGHDPTVQTLSLSIYTLLSNPDQLQLLREHPDRFPGAVEELLRYLTVQQFGVFRTAREDVEIAGETIEAGDPVLLSLFAANRDPAQFAEPDRLDVIRPPAQHVTFGHGVHQCLGQQLARVELGAALRGLLLGLPSLRLAVPAEDLAMRTDLAVYGVHHLPVTWDEP